MMENPKLPQLFETLREDLKKVSMPYEAHVQVENIMRHYSGLLQAAPNGAPPAKPPKPEKVKSNG